LLPFTNAAILMVDRNTGLRVIVQMHERRINKYLYSESSALETQWLRHFPKLLILSHASLRLICFNQWV
jgi:hypothetical protein